MDAVSTTPLTKKEAASYFWVTGLVGVVALVAWLYLPHSLIKLAAVGAAGAVFGLLVFAFPRFGLYFALYYVFAGITYYTSLPVAPAVTFLVTVGVVLQLLRGDSIELKDPLFNWSLAVFTVLVFQSLLFAYDYGYAFSSFDFFVKSMLIVFLVVQLIRTEKHLETLALVVFAAILSTVVLGVLNMQLGIIKDWTVLVGAIGWMRFGSTHINPNTAAFYLVAGLPLGVYAIKRVHSRWFKMLLIVSAVGMVVATIMTFSRQAVFPLAIVLLAILFKEARNKRVYAVIGLVAFVGFLLTPQYYWYRILTIGEVFDEVNQDFSLMIRVKALQTAWHLFLQHPFTGVGLNNFIVRSATELYVRMESHNGYLEILTGVGIFGFTAFILMPVAAVRGFVKAFKTRWPENHLWMKDLSYYFLLALVSVLVGVFFQHIHFYRIFWLPVAAGLVAGRLADRARSPEKKA